MLFVYSFLRHPICILQSTRIGFCNSAKRWKRMRWMICWKFCTIYAVEFNTLRSYERCFRKNTSLKKKIEKKFLI